MAARHPSAGGDLNAFARGLPMRSIVQLAGVATALVVSSIWSPASAANVVFVSATNGSDVAGCSSPTTPCRTLSFALTKVFNADDIVQLESGGNYFSATINSLSVTIYSPHGAAINGGESPCLTINNGATDVVTLDGIACVPGFGSDGIIFNGGEKLRIRNSRIKGAQDAHCGLLFQPSNPSAELLIENTLISENGTSGAGGGLCIQPVMNASVSGVIDRLTSQNNRWSLRASFVGSSKINLLLQNSIISHNVVGVRSAGAGSEIRVTNTSIYQNTTGIQPAAGGTIISYGDNVLSNNATNGAFSSTDARQ
jgi:hypothetical protein